MASSDRELAEQLREAGNLLMSPPSSVDELLPLLDQVENCLSRVEQSPSLPMQNAISPSLKALVTEQLFRHPDADVKVAVASCISEITRITAPEAPYDDEKMKEVFQLIVSSFENLCDNTSRSYSKRTSILETVAKVRSCVVMLDLECDALIIEMFQHLLKSIRDYHPENVFQCMETIMTLVLEESEDISTELLSPLLASVKRDDEEVLPVARKLAEKVFESCATKLKPYLIQAVNKLGISFDDYSKVVSSICQELSDPVEQNDATANEPVADDGKPAEEALDEKAQDGKEISGEAVPAEADLTNEKSLKSVVSNGIPEPKEDKTSNSLEKQDEGQPADQPKNIDASSTAEPDNLATEKLSNSESKVEQNTKKRGKSSTDGSHDEKEAEAIPEHKSDGKDSPGSAPEHQSDGKDAPGAAPEEQPIDAGISSENKKETVIQPSSPKATDSKSADVASPTASGNLPDENHPKMMERPKKKESLVKDITPADDASKKTSEGTNDSEAKRNRRSGKKVAAGKSNEEKTTTVTDEIKKESGAATELEAQPVKQPAEKVDAINNNADESASKQREDKKKRSRGKGVSEKDETKTSTKNGEKETVASPKSGKPSKDEPHVEKIPKNDLKRKLTPGKDKASGSIEYGENLIGSKVKVWWPIDKTFYEGVINSYDSIKKKHKILYNDGEQEILNLKRETWEFVQDDSESDEEEKAVQASPESSSDMPLKKKAKTTEQSTKQAKMDISPKTGGGGSSSKSKGKSNRKSKDDGKVDGKSKDGSKTGNKSEDDRASISKDHKAAGKSEDTLSMLKTSSKLKQDKSKQETPKPSSTAKGKPRKSGGKSNPNGTGKSKSGSSKVKESENVKENSTESAEGQESVKGKPASSSKSGKKRRR